MNNKLLVPFDFSVYATNALDYAVALAAQINASVTVFHTFQVEVIAPVGSEVGATTTYSQAVADKEKVVLAEKIDAVLQNFSDRFYLESPEKIKFETLIRNGDFEDSVKRHTEHVDYNLVVMGTRGAFGWEEVFGGSHTSQIMKALNANILVVPIEGIYKGIHHMVYASNFDKLDLAKLSEVTAFNEFFGARVTCLHVTDDASKAEKDQTQILEMEAKFKNIGEGVQFAQILDDQVEEAIFNYATDTDADILVVNPQKHGIIGSLFHESMTQKMTMHTSMPLLVVK